ncbi:MAG: hypothetical protein RLZZ490_617, partial [Cyanobacteriota bacterium]
MRDYPPSPIVQHISIPDVPLAENLSGTTNKDEDLLLAGGFALITLLLLVSILTGWQWF